MHPHRRSLLVGFGLIATILVGCTGFSVSVQNPDQGTLQAIQTELEAQASQIAAQGTFVSYLATRPALVVSPRAPGQQPTPNRPVQGFVLFQNGRCCVGGRAGSEAIATIQFEATSNAGRVTEMRYRVGTVRYVEADFSEGEWGPFIRETVVQIPVANNWVGYYVSAQFRDQAGNLSPVVYDDISVEGTP